jgi:hypothetical protein
MLRSLDPFPFDEIKTGGSAILRFARTVRGPGLSAIADLLDVANEANAAITAVGVEDQASLAALRGLGFTAAQGNHLGKVGDLKDFRPHRINEVRALLDLEPLSAENITALFRTEAPAATSAPEASTEDATGESEDALIDRLNERVAQFDSPSPAAAAQEVATAADSEEEKKSKAREKAKALALAKRAKARAERKNAAIERAKSKAAGKPTADITDVAQEDISAAPREMQERLNREFPAAQSDTAPKPAASPNADPAQQIAAQQAQQHAAAQQAAQQTMPAIAARVVEQQRPMQAKAAGGGMRSISMAVGASNAYFQPGIRVGAPALPEAPDEPVKPRALELPPLLSRQTASAKPPTPPPSQTPPSQTPNSQQPQQTQAPAAAKPAAPKSLVERAMDSVAKAPPEKAQTAAPKVAAEVAPVSTTVAAPAETPKTETKAVPAPEKAPDEIVQGDLNSDGADTAEAAKPVRRQKPFLKRRVYLSGYFWPRSWRRTWKRRAAARAANDDQQSSTEETAKAAE